MESALGIKLMNKDEEQMVDCLKKILGETNVNVIADVWEGVDDGQ